MTARRAAVVLLLSTACSRGPVPAPRPTPTPTPPPPPRVAVLVMENKEYEQVMGNPDAPYTNGLAHRYALATNLFAATHPSLPNYLALTGGDTFGVTTNCTDCVVKETNLVDQLEAAGISWKAYIEGVPDQPCFTGAGSGRYAKKHNPFAYYDTITTDPARCANVVPFTKLASDINSGSLPRFVWITPDMCNDSHDCDIASGDRFLAQVVPPLLRALGPRGVLFLTYDEGTTERGCCGGVNGGHIVTIVAGDGARPGRYDAPLSHYSILRAIEDRWGLPRLRRAASKDTPSMDAMLR